ncbi:MULTISPECIES: cobalt-precorrin-6A reductase [Rhizobiaceae]|uniref:Precorrin-6A/cobalt-precorrin-6A reductase n=1 Tax=Aliirhizobium cellulosilyticum TaxID=393664 RepID=A0A7W6Y3V3_9HYPH|nr:MULTISPECIES: cobalt-precorrin-6A reductase [Rhizobium/Agrobacterium group]MBB4351339.1 precorrin-6A/cobalt-precorrin-6A reductase [Rhizobium cellulosilyticum]MBB4414532.1 precorrin-6A/cobalt-precorrin-6A reductase [Rhizobium cellulosilyticum]MBB4449183.1 precorrin-6A/cobalt-precorrin-6A reductase [Rhizobium cellulosilyticum]
MTYSILILGGTAEAKALAAQLSTSPDYDILLSLAGRTKAPAEQPVPVRIGGFGGAGGLAAFLREKNVDLLIDATHPFAANISRNAAEAAALAGVDILALRRPVWSRQKGDHWQEVTDIAAAVQALDIAPRRVFLTLGRQELLPFEVMPQHSYLVRSVDPVDPPLKLPNVSYITARGPFSEWDETQLLEQHAIDLIVSKNSGGVSSVGKISAARRLGIEVVLIERPRLPDVPSARSVEELAGMVRHWKLSRRKRGE